MSKAWYFNPEMLFAFAFYQTCLQQQIIDLQRQVIELQQRIEKMTPANPPDEEVFWHVSSDGMLSDEAANSDDLATVRRFQKWNIEFAKKHIKPYVNSKVYGECLNQMTRGLPERIAKLETDKQTNTKPTTLKLVSSKKTVKQAENPKQLVLMQ